MCPEDQDYLSDLLLHGLVKDNECDVLTTSLKRHLFKGYDRSFYESFYGKGFTYSDLLDFNSIKLVTTWTNIFKLIFNNDFDLIIFPQVNIYRKFLFLSLILKRNLVIIDGQDYCSNKITIREVVVGIISFFRHFKIYHELRIKLLNRFFSALHLKRVVFFKREICDEIDAFPISYSFPEEKITKLKYKKNRILARIIPGIKNSYIYDDENSYYKSYRDSYFGLTTKKGGWDCLRHYEIIANNCIPYFPDLELCPKMTLHSFPKDTILETNEMFEQFSIGNINHDEWSRQQKQLFRYMNDFLTTEVVARYLVNKSKEFYNFNL